MGLKGEQMRTIDPVERLLTAEEVARVLHVSVAWVYDHADRKRPSIPSVRLGKAVRFRARDLEKFIEAMIVHADVAAV
jgi:excisionase family DNA binding protein